MLKIRYLPYTLIMLAGVIWGGTFLLILLATSEGAHPLAISAWQVVLTAGVFAAYSLLRKKPIFRPDNLAYYAVIAVVGITLPNLSYFYAASHLSAGILSISVSAVPVFTYAIMLALRFETMVIRRVAGIFFGMIAILLLVIPDQGLASDDANLWILLAVFCAFSYAVEGVYIGYKVDPDVEVIELLCGSNIVSACVLVPLVLWLGVSEPVTWLATPPGMGVVGVAVGSGIAYAMYFYTIKISGPVFASQCAYIITISGVILGIVIYREQHSFWVWIAVVVSMLGLALVTPLAKPVKS